MSDGGNDGGVWDFMVTYGWAVFVVLVAIGALWYFGVLNPEKFIPDNEWKDTTVCFKYDYQGVSLSYGEILILNYLQNDSMNLINATDEYLTVERQMDTIKYPCIQRIRVEENRNPIAIQEIDNIQVVE